MKITTKTYYECEICNSIYTNENEAIQCESKPIQDLNPVNIGDLVTPLTRDGKGEVYKVVRKIVVDKDWGHYEADRYHHTYLITAERNTGILMSRVLTFDEFKKKRKGKFNV